MAIKRICSIPNCGKAHWGHGWCAAHHGRWLRHGDPLAGRTNEGAILSFIENIALQHTSNECLIWPYSQTHGYGKIKIGGSTLRANRYVCELAHGKPPSSHYEAAHNCGNPACVNPKHLRWATPKENQADRVLHGTDMRGEKSPNAKLSADQVREIRRINGYVPQHKIAAAFGISQAAVNSIVLWKSWKWVT